MLSGLLNPAFLPILFIWYSAFCLFSFNLCNYKYLDDSNKSGLCVYHNDKLIGYILYKSLYNFINIDSLGVIYEYRNKGIGTLLIKFLINLAKKNKMNIRLQVRISNIIAINLYSKLGFKKKSILKNYYSNEDGWLMECLCW